MSNNGAKVSVDFDKDLLQKNVEDKSMKNDIEIIDGITHFKNNKVFLDFFENDAKKLRLFQNTFKNQFAVKNEIVSNIENDLNSAQNANDIDRIVAKYPEYLKIQDSTVVFIGKSIFYPLLTHPSKNYFYVGKMIHLIEENSSYIIVDGDLNKISKIKNKEKNQKNVFEFENKVKMSKKGKPNASAINASDFNLYGRAYNYSNNNKRGCVGLRLERIQTATGQNNSNGQPTFYVKFSSINNGYAERKFIFWGIVQSYKTLVPNFKFTSYLNGVLVASNADMPKPVATIISPSYESAAQYTHFSNLKTGILNYLPVTQIEINSTVNSFVNTGGFFTTEQVPGVNIGMTIYN